MVKETQLVACACGCGTQIEPRRADGRPKRFVNWHSPNRKKYKSEAEKLLGRRTLAKARVARNVESVRESKRNRYRMHKLMAMELLGNSCYFCGTPYTGKNAAIFEFHHTSPELKDSGITRILQRKWCDSVVEELRKCVLTCANCHNQQHTDEW